MDVCSVDECDGPTGKGVPHTARGLCVKHYTRWLRHGDPLVTLRNRPAPGTVCSIPGCDQPYFGKGYCGKHHQRLLKYGDPLTVQVRVPLVGACSVEECGKPIHAVGLCNAHHLRWLKRGHPDPILAPSATRIMSKCRVCSHPQTELIDAILDARSRRAERPWHRLWGPEDAPTCIGPGCDVRLVGKSIRSRWCSKGCRSRAYRQGMKPPPAPAPSYEARFPPYLRLTRIAARFGVSASSLSNHCKPSHQLMLALHQLDRLNTASSDYEPPRRTPVFQRQQRA